MSLHRLNNLEPLELRVPEIKRLVPTRTAMRLTERLRRGPSLEYGLVVPNGMRGIQHMILPHRTTQKME